MKWQKLLWSVVLIWGMALLYIWMVSKSDNQLVAGFGIFVILFYTTTAVSPVMIALRLFRIIRRSDSFFYIFMGLLTLVTGIMGIFSSFRSGNPDRLAVWRYFQYFDVLIALVIFYDVFVKPFPSRKS